MQIAAIAGATGFVGSHLVPELVRRGNTVRALVRNPGRVEDPDVDIFVVDIDTGQGLDAALADVDTAVWLIHRMAEGGDFADKDLAAARRFADAASRAGVRRIVYLGGMVPGDAQLSEHLRSRGEVGDALRSAGVPVSELRASVILGAGSASFEIMRQLTEHLPVMVTPTWVKNRTQPIAVADLVDYLATVCLDERALGRTFDVGGPEVLTFIDMMRRYARHRGLAQYILPVPVLSPKLSSRWIGLVTDVDPVLARPLVDSLVHETVCREFGIREINDRELLSFEAAIGAAIEEAHMKGLRTHMGRDFKYVAHLAVGMALDAASIEVTESRLPEGTELAFSTLTAMGLYAAGTMGAERKGMLTPHRDALSAGAVAGVATAVASGLFVLVAGRNPWVRSASLRALNRDRKTGPLSPAVLAAMGISEELYWRGTMQHMPWSKGRAIASTLAWIAPVLASRDPMLSLSAVTLGPLWSELSRRHGPVAAATAHAVWLPATRWVARRRFLGPGSTRPHETPWRT